MQNLTSSGDKKTIAVDLDGTLAKVYETWHGIESIGDPIDGAREFLQAIRDRGYRILIFTARIGAVEIQPDGRQYTKPELVAMVKMWLDMHNMPYDDICSGEHKPTASAFIDDRAVPCRPLDNGPHGLYSTRHVYDMTLRHMDKVIDGNKHHKE